MRAGIAFGSNLGDRLAQLRCARAAVCDLPAVSAPVIASCVYETEPVDAEGERFLNAVLEVEFTGHPAMLLDALQSIEAQLERPSKRPRNSPRTIDLDVLYAGNLVLKNEEMVIPHPRLHRRRFVLQPLADIRPELVLPGLEASVGELLENLQDSAGVQLFTEGWEP